VSLCREIKSTKKIAEVRGLEVGPILLLARLLFSDWNGVEDSKLLLNKVREVTGGIPIGSKIAASHIEKDISFACGCWSDYIIFGWARGRRDRSGTVILRDNIMCLRIPAFGKSSQVFWMIIILKHITLIVTGGLPGGGGYAKALMLGGGAYRCGQTSMQA